MRGILNPVMKEVQSSVLPLYPYYILGSGYNTAIIGTRATTGTAFDAGGALNTYAVNELRQDYSPITGALKGLLIEEARTNLIANSEDISASPWWSDNGSRTADTGVASPIDGVNYGGFVMNSTTSSHRLMAQQLMSAGKRYSYSAFIRAGDFSHILLSLQAYTAGWAPTGLASIGINLNTGLVENTTDSLGFTLEAYSVTNLGNEDFLVTITADIAAGTDLYYNRAAYRITNSSYGNVAGDGTTVNMYTTGGQLEEGYPSSYIATSGATVTRSADIATVPLEIKAKGSFSRASLATYWNSALALTTAAIDEPRYQYNPDTGVYEGLLIEPASTNLLSQSEDFSAWNATNVVVAVDQIAAPDGNITMDKITRTSTGGNWIARGFGKAAEPKTYTASLFVKADTGNFLALRLQGTYPARADVCFDLSSGTISSPAIVGTGFTNPSATISVEGGYYRITLTATTDNATSSSFLIATRSITGYIDWSEPSSTASGFIWGSQIEEGSTASSYIPTVASAVTRAADIANMPITAEVSLVGEFTMPAPNGSGVQAVFRANVGVGFSELIRLHATDTPGKLQLRIRTGGADVFSAIQGGFTVGSQVKFAVLVKDGDNALILNGAVVSPGVNTNGTPVGIDVIGLGCAPNGTQQLDEHLKTLTFYQTRLTNEQGKALTS